MNGVGAIIKGFQNAIPAHDEHVKLIEEKITEIKALKRIYNKKNRLFRNLDSAWNGILEDNPNEFHEYELLVPKMRNIEQRFQYH